MKLQKKMTDKKTKEYDKMYTSALLLKDELEKIIKECTFKECDEMSGE